MLRVVWLGADSALRKCRCWWADTRLVLKLTYSFLSLVYLVVGPRQPTAAAATRARHSAKKWRLQTASADTPKRCEIPSDEPTVDVHWQAPTDRRQSLSRRCGWTQPPRSNRMTTTKPARQPDGQTMLPRPDSKQMGYQMVSMQGTGRPETWC